MTKPEGFLVFLLAHLEDISNECYDNYRKVERQVSVGCLLHREDIEMNLTKYMATYDNYIYLLGA